MKIALNKYENSPISISSDDPVLPFLKDEMLPENPTSVFH